MKQLILIGVLTGLLTATIPLQAQVAQRDSDARKGSRLELGRTSSSQKTTGLPSQRFSMTPNPGLSGLDRSISLNKNTAINAHYRSLLMAKPAAKTTTRAVTTENLSTAVSDVRPAVSQEANDESRNLYSSEKLWVSNAYPNPADDIAELNYQFNAPVNEAKLTLLNVLGTPITDHELDRNERKVRIATRQLDSGYYLYQLTVDGKKVATKRLLVRHQ